MIFEAKCKSIRFLVVLGLVGTTWVADCQAERNPVVPVKQNFCQNVIGSEVVAQMKAFKEDRKRNEQRWSEFSQFVGQQAAVVSDKLVSSGIGDWWQQRVSPSPIPMVQRQAGNESNAISPSCLLIKLAGNLSVVQWWEVSSQATGMFETAQHRLVQTSTKSQVEFQKSLLRLVQTSSSNLGQQVRGLAAVEFVRGIFAGSVDQLASGETSEAVNVNEGSSADPYWSYYSDCDFWGADFNRADEE